MISKGSKKYSQAFSQDPHRRGVSHGGVGGNDGNVSSFKEKGDEKTAARLAQRPSNRTQATTKPRPKPCPLSWPPRRLIGSMQSNPSDQKLFGQIWFLFLFRWWFCFIAVLAPPKDATQPKTNKMTCRQYFIWSEGPPLVGYFVRLVFLFFSRFFCKTVVSFLWSLKAFLGGAFLWNYFYLFWREKHNCCGVAMLQAFCS